MGVIDAFIKVSDALETAGKVANFVFSPPIDKLYEVHIDSISIFDINPLRIQTTDNRGVLLKTEPLKKRFLLDYHAGTTGRYSIRLDLLTMLKNTLSSCRKISMKNIRLAEATNYLMFEGCAKKRWGKWIITNNIKQATNYVAYTLTFFDCNGGKKEKVEHDTLYRLFIDDLKGNEYQNPSFPL